MKGIEEKSIIVTGGAQGLGEGIVRRLTDGAGLAADGGKFSQRERFQK